MIASQTHIPARPWPAPKGVITFFYYDDLAGAIDFYQRVIGLNKVEDFGWGVILELQPRTYLGLMNATAGSQQPVPGANKGVLLSIETADLEACLEQMQRIGVASHATRLVPGCDGRTVEFKIVDPGGYSVELFRWV